MSKSMPNFNFGEEKWVVMSNKGNLIYLNRKLEERRGRGERRSLQTMSYIAQMNYSGKKEKLRHLWERG